MQIQDVQAVRRWVGSSKPWLSSFLGFAPSIPSIVSVVVMGSAVRPGTHRRSDFDLLVIYKGERPKLEAPAEVDIRQIPAERVNQLVSSGHEILCWALKFGTPVYDQNGFWQTMQESWIDHLPLPSASEARKRGKQALERAQEMLLADDESAADDLLLAALTQFVRERLIKHGVFPASRPELPTQLREIDRNDRLATLLDDAMYKEEPPRRLMERLEIVGLMK